MFPFGDAADFTAKLTVFLACTLAASLAENQPYFQKAEKPMTVGSRVLYR